jgi:formylglycine-generating enzyme required for sulfatase activity/dienelactone hydrolase
MSDDLVGRTISHYRVIRRLGGGGMGVVYRAEDVRLKRSVALKFLPPSLTRDEEARARFAREAQAASALDHPAICTIHDIDETEDGRLFIAMALYEGETLKERLKRGPLEVDEALDIAAAAADGLARAHEGGIIHRDVKPANLMLTPAGGVKILDFGVAKLTGASELTRMGVLAGTVTYMSPEQIEGRDVDGRADVWALGLVLYEMLTGRNPFRRDRPEVAAAAILSEDPAPPSAVRDGLSPALDALLADALRKDRDARLRSAEELGRRIGELRPPAAAAMPGTVSRWVWALSIAGIAAVGGLLAQNRARAGREAARASLPVIAALADSGRYEEAYALATETSRKLGEDSTVSRLLSEVTDVLTVESQPSGARVRLTRFPESGADTVSRDVGTTPIHDLEVPRSDYRVVVSLEGYVPVERLASSTQMRSELAVFGGSTRIALHVPLQPIDGTPADMVFVPGGTYELVSHAAPRGDTADLDAFFIDRFEVTNADYMAFVRAGGYANSEYWDASFVRGGRTLSWEEGTKLLVDRSGLPGPRTWSGGEFPEGQASHPVSGVTWYEAAAYARFVGKQLPTLYQWEKTARDGRIAHREGVILPWGYEGPGEGVRERAAFATTGTTSVDRYPFGISPYGAYAMAGNVREWTRTAADSGHIATGGSWQDPAYLFNAIGVYDDLFAASDLGFRCVRPARPEADRAGDGFIDLARRTPTYHPVDSATFVALLTHYRYDRTPLDAQVVDRVETPDWVRVKVAYDGPGDDRALGYLFLPLRATPPYQTLVFIPGASAFYAETAAEAAEWVLGPLVRGGRAVFAPVLLGMRERAYGSTFTAPEPQTVAYRDLMVQQATEMRRGMDYLETRDDIDADRLAYVGLSFGAGSHLVFAGTDDRFKAVVLLGGGIDERLMPTLPEASSVNFAPWIHPPKLLVNGTTDDEHPWLTRGLPLWNLLRQPKELVLVQGAGHVPPVEARVPAITKFLDSHLGRAR